MPAASLVGRRLQDVRAPQTAAASGDDPASAPQAGTLCEETHRRADRTWAPSR